MCTQCARNMLGTTFVSHTKHWKTPQHRQNREKQENHVVSLSHREIAISSPFRDPKNDPEASLSPKSALMYTQCTHNMLGTTFVSHTQPWKTTQHRQHREKQENHVVSLSHREIAIASSFRDPKNDPEASISTESALMCTQCARNMLGTTFVSDIQPCKTPQHRQNREKQENHVVSLSRREIAIASPFRDPKNDPEASISP